MIRLPQLHLHIEPYQIPRFYQLLEEQGIKPEAPHDFEAFRGSFQGGWISISVHGDISHSQHQPLQQIIDQVFSRVTQQDAGASDVQSQYMVLARRPLPVNNYPVNHLNIWLNPRQYEAAIQLLQDAGAEVVDSHYNFEELLLELDRRYISFHDNGKVIADDGYSTFAPILSQAIEQHQPFADYDLIIGQDEVGTGERIGPVVIGTVAATPSQLTDLQLAGIKDSKMIPKKLSGIMTRWIRDLATVVSSFQLEPMEFNQLVLGERLSIPEIIAYCHNHAVEQMLHHLQLYRPDLPGKIVYVVDQFDKYQSLQALEDSMVDLEIRYMPHGEQNSVSVAAASVVAKAERLRWIQLHEKVYGLELRRKRVRYIRRHAKAHELLKIIG